VLDLGLRGLADRLVDADLDDVIGAETGAGP
jgi:hypothetical protein